MTVLVDTNVLLRGVQFSHPMRQTADDALTRLRQDGHTLCVVPQVVCELWVVATRPVVAKNGLGKTPAEAALMVGVILSTFRLLPDSEDIFPAWRALVTTHAVSGKPAHNARLVAAMQVHGVTHLLTFNVTDFSRFPVTALDPAAVAVAPTAPPAP